MTNNACRAQESRSRLLVVAQSNRQKPTQNCKSVANRRSARTRSGLGDRSEFAQLLRSMQPPPRVVSQVAADAITPSFHAVRLCRSLDLRDVMDRRQVLIVNLSKGRLSEDNSTLLGRCSSLAFSGQRRPERTSWKSNAGIFALRRRIPELHLRQFRLRPQ